MNANIVSTVVNKVIILMMMMMMMMMVIQFLTNGDAFVYLFYLFISLYKSYSS